MPLEYIAGITIAIFAYVVGLFTNRPGEKPVETQAPVQQPAVIVAPRTEQVYIRSYA